MTREEEEYLWTLPRYNPPGLLVGPLPYVKRPSGWYAPDYRHPGVRERIAVEVNFTMDQERHT